VAGDFVGQDELEELGVAHAANVGERVAFGGVSRQRPSFTWRSSVLSSALTVGALIGPLLRDRGA
jgi:hypothetical protein